MISPLSSVSLSQQQNLSDKKNVSFCGLTEIVVKAADGRPLRKNYDELGRIIDRFRNILFRKVKPNSKEQEAAFGTVRHTFCKLDSDYFCPEKKVRVLYPICKRIRVGSRFLFIIGNDAITLGEAGQKIGANQKYRGYAAAKAAHDDLIAIKKGLLNKFDEGDGIVAPKKSVVTIYSDDDSNILGIQMRTSSPPFISDIDIPQLPKKVKKVKSAAANEPTISRTVEPVSQPVAPVNKNQQTESPKPTGQLTFDF